MANVSVYSGRRACALATIALLIITYFCFSIGLTFYQRWFIRKLKFPLLVGLCHMGWKMLLSWLARFGISFFTNRTNSSLYWRDVLRSTLPVGLTSGIDIASSNWALEYITISLYTMTKSTSIIFILLFALLFKLETKSWSMFGIVCMISSGLAMFTYESTEFHLFGFLLVLFASFCSGLRWTLCQFVMQKSDLGLTSPLDMMYHLQPWMFLSILPFFIAFEGSTLWDEASRTNMDSVLYNFSYITIGAFLAVGLELTEYKVVSSLSSLTLSIAAVFKEVITITLAIIIARDQLSPTNGIGLLLCLGGIVLHVAAKATHSSQTNSHHPVTRHHLTDDDAAQHFLQEESDIEESNDEDTEVLFSVLHSRDR